MIHIDMDATACQQQRSQALMKLVKNRTVLGICISALGAALFLWLFLTGKLNSVYKTFLVIVVLIASQIPLIAALIEKKIDSASEKTRNVPQIKTTTFRKVRNEE